MARPLRSSLWGAKEADASLAALERSFRDTAPSQIAEAHAFRGEPDRVFQWLERAYEQRDAGLTEMEGSRLPSALHGDARWPAFLERMKLPAP